MKILNQLTIAAGLLLFAGVASADPMVLGDTYRCGAENATNGVSVDDVTGNAGGSDECWGTIEGNDPKNDGISIDGDLFEYVAKINQPVEGSTTQNPEGAWEAINLAVTPSLNGQLSGDWSFNGFGGDSFLIILKGGPLGWAAWLFSGDSADSVSGSWNMWGQNGLSHLAIYRGPGSITSVPEPGTLALLGLGLIGIGVAARRRKDA